MRAWSMAVTGPAPQNRCWRGRAPAGPGLHGTCSVEGPLRRGHANGDPLRLNPHRPEHPDDAPSVRRVLEKVVSPKGGRPNVFVVVANTAPCERAWRVLLSRCSLHDESMLAGPPCGGWAWSSRLHNPPLLTLRGAADHPLRYGQSSPLAASHELLSTLPGRLTRPACRTRTSVGAMRPLLLQIAAPVCRRTCRMRSMPMRVFPEPALPIIAM